MPTLITDDTRSNSANGNIRPKRHSNSSPPPTGKESVQEMEERLREKLKRKAEDRKSKVCSTLPTYSTSDQNLEPKPDKTKDDQPNTASNGKRDENGGKSKLQSNAKQSEGGKHNLEEKKVGRRARGRRNRRRRQKRQERNAHAQSLANSSSMMDNRTYYSQEHYNGGGRPPHGGGGGGGGGRNYRGGPGPIYQGGRGHDRGPDRGHDRGPDGPRGSDRWEYNGPPNDRGGHRSEYDRGNGKGNDRYHSGRDPGWGASRGGENFGPRGGGRSDPFPPRGRGGDNFSSQRGASRGGDNFSRGRGDNRGRGRSDDMPPRGGSRSRGRSRSYSRSRSRSSDGSGSYSSNSVSTSRSYKRGRSRSLSSDVSSRSFSRSRSRGSSRSRSRSPSQSSSVDPRSNGNGRLEDKRSNRSNSRSQSSDRYDRRDKYNPKKRRLRDSPSPTHKTDKDKEEDDAVSKDQRTVFVSQLVMRAEESEIQRYFHKKCGCKVNEVILLRDRRTGRHKGCAYVELGRLEDVPRALKFSGVAPTFQRFPILIKVSEAEKNYSEKQVTVATAIGMVTGSAPGIIPGLPEKRVEAQKVYVGSIDRNITQAQLYAIFSQFGQLDKVLLQVDPLTGISKGYAFLSFADPKAANLAIQVMRGQHLAGRELRTGWASVNPNAHGLEEVSSQEFPADAAQRVQNVGNALTSLNGTGLIPTAGLALVSGMCALATDAATANGLTLAEGAPAPVASHITSVAEQAINAALGLPTASSTTLTTDTPAPSKPTKNILVRNMFDKDTETEDGWEEEIELDFKEEAEKHGKLLTVKVLSQEVGGKIFATFETIEAAKACAEDLSGRWFDKRQLQVEYMEDGVDP